MTVDLAGAIRAAIDETERIARAPKDGSAPWTGEWSAGKDGEGGALYTRNGWYLASQLRGEPIEPGVLAHIVHNDPAAVLRRCAADRRILDLHQPDSRRYEWTTCCICISDRDGYEELWQADQWPCPTVLAVAEAYGVRPGD